MKKSMKVSLYSLSVLAMFGLAACSSQASSTTTVNLTTTTSSQTTTSGDTASTSIDTSSYFTDKDSDASYDASTAATIKLSGSSATVSGSGVSQSGSTVTISAEGTYIISGTSDNVQIVVAAADTAKVQLVFDNVTMTGKDAPINIQSGDKVFITLAEGSTNSISDSASPSNTEIDAAIYSASDLTFNGTGSLTITGNYNNAIESNDDVRITGGTYKLTAVGHGINANDAINIKDASLDISAQEDGLHADNSTDASLGNIYLQDTTVTVSATDDGIHASNALVINGGNVTVGQSYEGLEGRTIDIKAGNVTINASDDGINAADASNMGSAIGLTISGGQVNVVAVGDGLDSNGNIEISGGTVLVNGAPNPGNGALDYDGTGTITGGTAVIVGSSGMAQGFSTGSSQASVNVTAQGGSGSTIVLSDSSGKEIVNYTASQTFDSVLISSADLVEGETYTVTVDGQAVTQTASLSSGTMDAFGGPRGGGRP